MPERIYKYNLKPQKFQVVEIPMGGQVINVDMQRENLLVWVLHSINQPSSLPPTEKMGIEIFGTGHEIPDISFPVTRKFIKTVMAGEYLVWHVFRIWNYENVYR